MIVYLINDNYKQLVKDELVDKTKIVASVFEIRIINEIPKNQTGKILYSKLE
jgi:acyl-coenzyme A synthetase/AMP-(fatty) acid ligase